MNIKETAREIEVLDQVDVVVAGGGIAGCTAAISAAEAGAKVLLVERNGCLGGVLTSNIIPNLLNNHVSANFEQLLSGVPRRIIERLVTVGGCIRDWNKPQANDHPVTVFSTELWNATIDRMTVNLDGSVKMAFRNGIEITV